MAMLTKEQILGADDLKTEVVAVPEWGGKVIVQEMTGTDRDYWEMNAFQFGPDGEVDEPVENYGALLLSMCIVNEDGERLFDEADIPALGKKSSTAMGRVTKVARKLNGLTKDSKDEAGKD